MEYLKTATKDIYIRFDGVTATVLNKAELTKELEFATTQLASLPKPLTDKEKIAWYDEHCDESGYDKSRDAITNQLAELTATLEAIKAV